MILKRTNLPSGHVVPHPQQSTSIFGVWPPLTKAGEKNWLRHLVNWTENFSSLEEIKRVDLQPIPIFGVWSPLIKAREKIWSRHMVNWTQIFSSLEEIMGVDFSPIFFKNSVKFSLFFFGYFFTIAMNQHKHCQFYRWNWYIINVLMIFSKILWFFYWLSFWWRISLGGLLISNICLYLSKIPWYFKPLVKIIMDIVVDIVLTKEIEVEVVPTHNK